MAIFCCFPDKHQIFVSEMRNLRPGKQLQELRVPRSCSASRPCFNGSAALNGKADFASVGHKHNQPKPTVDLVVPASSAVGLVWSFGVAIFCCFPEKHKILVSEVRNLRPWEQLQGLRVQGRAPRRVRILYGRGASRVRVLYREGYTCPKVPPRVQPQGLRVQDLSSV